MINPIKHVNEGREYLFVEVPGLQAYFMKGHTTLGYADSITESQAAEIVETHDCWWRNYTNEMKTCFGPIHSLESLLTSHGLKMEGTLILQKL